MTSRSRLQLVILPIAVVVSSVIVFNVGIQMAKDRCLDSGGRIVEAGLDRICDLGAGRTLPLTIAPATPLAWFTAVALWIVLILGLTWGVSRLMPSRR
jgi:hypothetical protein